MNIRRIFWTVGGVSAFIVTGLILYTVWYNQFNDIPTDQEAIQVLDERLQMMSEQAPFAYSLISFKEAVDSALSGHVWCAVVQPPVEYKSSPSNETMAVDHFVIFQRSGGEWGGSMFEDQNLYEGYWVQDGCGNW